MCLKFNICCSPALVGFIFIQPHSYVYSFNSTSKELVVIKTRTVHNPKELSKVSGPLKVVDTNSQLQCSEYEDKIMLINFGSQWNNFNKTKCKPKAAIIKAGTEMEDRHSSPVNNTDLASFPIVIIYEDDDERLEGLDDYQATILFTNDKDFLDAKVPCNEDSCTRLVS